MNRNNKEKSQGKETGRDTPRNEHYTTIYKKKKTIQQ